MPEMVSIDGRISPQVLFSEHLEMGGSNPGGAQIGVSNRYLLKDGKPWLPVMGEIHFSRYPRQYWEEALLKIKAAGISIVASYFFWIHHEEIEGRWKWDGNRAVRSFAALCAKHDLYFFPRIGPWAHGECRNGGFPDWLLKKCPAVRTDDPLYLGYVVKLFQQIYEQLKGCFFHEGGPIIGIQLENEYGHVGGHGHEGHILTLKAMAKRIGFDVPIYTVTGWGGAWIPEREVLPVLGAYPAAPWTQHTQQLPPTEAHLFQAYANDGNIGADLAVRTIRRTRFDPHLYPYFTCETGAGNQVTAHRRPLISPEDGAAISYTQVGSGANMLGYYVFHGGTNPVGELSTLQESRDTGYPNDLPVLSYDFQAPIREYGQLHDSYRRLKMLHLFLQDFGEWLAPMTAVFPEMLPDGAADAETLRSIVRVDESGSGFVFVNNHQRHVVMREHRDVTLRIHLPDGDLVFPPFDVQSDACFVWPFNLDLDGVKLFLAQAQLVCRVMAGDVPTYVFATTPGVPPLYHFHAASVQGWQVARGGTALVGCAHDVVAGEDGMLVVSSIQPGTGACLELETVTGQTVRILTLPYSQALNLWKGQVAGQERLVLTESAVQFDRGALVLTGRHAAQDVCLYPGPAGLQCGGDALRSKADGVFSAYRVNQPERPIRLHTIPADKPYVWHIHLPKDVLAEVNDVFLRLDIACDKAYLYIGKDLVADDFYHGEVWEVGLKRFAHQLARMPVLTLVLEPLAEDAGIYFDRKPQFVEGVAGHLYSVAAVPEFTFAIR